MRRSEKRRRRRRETGSIAPPAAELEHARRHLERLYDIGKLLARFDGVSRTLPNVLALAAEVLHFRVAVMIEAREGAPRTFAWHASEVDPSEVPESKKLARRSYAYLAGSAPSQEWVSGGIEAEDTSTTLETLNRPEGRLNREVTLPLAVDRRPVFGVLRVTCRSTLDAIDLSFLNAVANQIAVALDRYHARRQEVALRKHAESLAQAREESLLHEQEARAAAQESLAREKAALLEAREAVLARDAFIAVASHELNNPLCALQINVGLVLKYLAKSPDERVTSTLEAAKRQIGRMTRLIHNLLDVSRITAGKLDLELEDVDLAAVVRDVAERSADELKQAGSALTLNANTPAVGCWDPLRLDQVVMNLLSNAMKYGEGKPIEVTVESDDKKTRLSVRDSGIGIEPEDQQRIFERFERAGDERKFAGFGLGLWIVRLIVEAMGGTISVTSRAGKGSLFIVELPRFQAASGSGSHSKCLRQRRFSLSALGAQPAGGFKACQRRSESAAFRVQVRVPLVPDVPGPSGRRVGNFYLMARSDGSIAATAVRKQSHHPDGPVSQ